MSDPRRRPPGSTSAYMRENDEHANMLSDKVGQLREISLMIGEEVRSQTRELSDMEDVFSQTREYLGKTMNRLSVLARSENGRWMWYLLGFVLLTILYLYFFHIR